MTFTLLKTSEKMKSVGKDSAAYFKIQSEDLFRYFSLDHFSHRHNQDLLRANANMYQSNQEVHCQRMPAKGSKDVYSWDAELQGSREVELMSQHNFNAPYIIDTVVAA
jgi:hypothetical protein